ncbi:hypothetical protein GOAMR_15_00050 [Gordonia amarae NBRC 15530]|uniref:Pullulanase n=2 Tax=Gordonia amarae TaxID=36821 RepID=G7GKU8_9ACTN|nr:hypothetical protein GOAMR_15_00050 [Gordonia amarae NBRC 15530]
MEPNGVRLRHILMDSLIDYIFGPGDGSVTTWTSRADLDLSGDGVADAVRLDFDGDGRRDDAMWDTDGDGVADLVAIDIADQPDPGTQGPPAERFYSDSGKGLWDVRETDPPKAGDRTPSETTKPESTGPDDRNPGSARSDGHPPKPDPATGSDRPEGTQPGSGPSRGASHDLDGDGHRDIELLATRGGGGRLYLDTDGDGVFDQVLIDSDGDGRADSMRRRGEPGFDR